MKPIFEVVRCAECDHEHEVPVIRGETPYDDYAEVPEMCEECGEAFLALTGIDEQAAERRQMGITE